jgi:hypothetical protein
MILWHLNLEPQKLLWYIEGVELACVSVWRQNIMTNEVDGWEFDDSNLLA